MLPPEVKLEPMMLMLLPVSLVEAIKLASCGSIGAIGSVGLIGFKASSFRDLKLLLLFAFKLL